MGMETTVLVDRAKQKLMWARGARAKTRLYYRVGLSAYMCW